MENHLRAKREQLNQFLDAVQKVNDSFIFDIAADGTSHTVVVTQDETCFLYGTTIFEESVACSLNIPDVKKLGRALKIIQSEDITLDLTPNAIKYHSKITKTKFTYHLHDENLLKRPKIKVDKVKTFKWDVEVMITKSSIQQMLKNASFVDDATKLYLYSDGESIMGEISDKSRANTNSYAVMIVDNVKQTIPEIIIKLDSIQSVTFLEEAVSLKINTSLGLVAFETSCGDNKLLYIITSLKQ